MKPIGLMSMAGAACLALVAVPALAAGHDTAPGATGAKAAKPRLHGYVALFSRADTNGDGRLSPDEIKAWRQSIFESRDSNGDGKLTKDELVAAAMKRAQQRITRRVDARMARRDKNGDGMISLDEAVSMRGIERMFKRLDTNGDGMLSAAEMMRAASLRKHAPGAGSMQGEPSAAPSGN